MADEEVGVRLSLKDRKRFSSEADRAAKDIDKISNAAKRANRSTREASGGVDSLRTQLGGIASIGRKVVGVGAAIGGAAGAAGLFGIRTASSLEQAQIGFTTMLGSAQKAQSFIGEMQAFAKKTPFEFTDVQTAASRMLAFGFTAEQVLPTLTSIGNAAAALGTGSEGINRITTAIGQIKTKGRVQSQELLQLMEAGIPALDMLSQRLGKTPGEVQDMVEKGLVPAGVAIEAFTTGMDRRYAGLMEKQSRTLSGMFSNLKDTVTLGSARVFAPLVDELKFAMPGAIAGTGRAMDWLGLKMGLVAGKIRQWREDGTFTRLWERARAVAGDLAAVWSGSLWPALQDLATAFGPLVGYLSLTDDVLRFWADHPQAGETVFVLMATAITGFKVAELIIGVRNAMIGLNAAMYANPITLVIAAAAALVIGLGILYNKLNEGRPIWETAMAAVSPFAFIVLTIMNRLDGVGRAIDRVQSKLSVLKDAFLGGPWGAGKGVAGFVSDLFSGIPGQASGGITTRPGMSLVGERGPELLTLPRGARVDPLPQDHELPSFDNHVNVYVSGADVLHAQRVADVVVERIQDKLART